MRTCGVILGIVVFSSAHSSAQLIYPVEQDRGVQAVISPLGGPEVNDSATCPDLAPWLESVAAHWEAEGGGSLREANAAQYSEAMESYLDVFGYADFLGNEGYHDVAVQADNHARFRFAVAEPLSFDLTGTISAETELNDLAGGDFELSGCVNVRLNRVAGTQVFAESAAVLVTEESWPKSVLVERPLAFGGALEPGVYELSVEAQAYSPAWTDFYGMDGFLVQAAFVVSVDFAPLPPPDPAAGDLDGDGDVDMGDLARMQQYVTGPRP